jgi:hypothetical protein
MSQTLVVVLGAGASISAGLPSTACLTTLVDGALPGKASAGYPWSPYQGPLPGQSISYEFANSLRAAARAHFKSQFFPQGYQFENLLGVVEELEDYTRRQTFLSSVAVLAEHQTVLDDGMMVSATRQCITDAIHRHVGEKASLREVQTHEATIQLQRLLGRLATRFRLVVIDLNYDDVADNAQIHWSDGYESVFEDALIFDPEQWIRDVNDSSRHLLMHLHGSIRFGRLPNVSVIINPEEPAKYASYEIANEHLAGEARPASADGRSYSASYIISGTSKASKMIYNMRPYGYYLSAMAQLVPVSDALLSIGYGWGDPHVNTLLDEFIEQRPAAPTVVVTRRTGLEFSKNMQTGNEYLERLACVPFVPHFEWSDIASPGRKISWAGGRLRLFHYGLPLSRHGEDAVISHLGLASGRLN